MSEPSGSSEPVPLRLALACELAEPRRAAQALHGFLAQQGCSESELMDCELALVEACNNAIKHADEAGRKLPVMVEARCTPQMIELSVSDHTPGFDWPRQVSLPDPESEHGRGLFLIHAVMDSVQYVRNSTDNTLRFSKKRNQAPPA